jgi:hypothetical protein
VKWISGEAMVRFSDDGMVTQFDCGLEIDETKKRIRHGDVRNISPNSRTLGLKCIEIGQSAIVSKS